MQHGLPNIRDLTASFPYNNNYFPAIILADSIEQCFLRTATNSNNIDIRDSAYSRTQHNAESNTSSENGSYVIIIN